MSAWWPIRGSPLVRWWQPAVKGPARFQRHEVFGIQHRAALTPRCICGWSIWPTSRTFCGGMSRHPYRLTASKKQKIVNITKNTVWYIFSTLCREHYVTSLSWVHLNQQISVVWMNRAQNLSIISSCSSPKWICVEVIEMCLNDFNIYIYFYFFFLWGTSYS